MYVLLQMYVLASTFVLSVQARAPLGLLVPGLARVLCWRCVGTACSLLQHLFGGVSFSCFCQTRGCVQQGGGGVYVTKEVCLCRLGWLSTAAVATGQV